MPDHAAAGVHARTFKTVPIKIDRGLYTLAGGVRYPRDRYITRVAFVGQAGLRPTACQLGMRRQIDMPDVVDALVGACMATAKQ